MIDASRSSFGPRARELYHPYEQAAAEAAATPYARPSRYLLGVDQHRSEALRFRHCLSTTTTTTTTTDLEQQRVPGALALTSAEATLAFNVSARRLTVPKVYTAAFLAFETEVNFATRCVLCGELFTGALTGTLSCAYHPFEYVNTATNSSGYSVAREPPTNCVQCAELHLMPSARNDHLVAENLRFGCTAIDHCTNVYEVLTRPYIAIPTIFWSMFALSKRSGALRDFDALAANADAHRGIIVVHQAAQLRLMLVVDIPGTRNAFRASVAHVYERMAARFNIQALADEVYSARIATVESSISRMAQFSHRDAERRDSLRRMQRKKARFAPFVIVARVMQCEGGGMRLEEE